MSQTLLIFGLGYSGRAIATAAAAAGCTVIATSRNPAGQGVQPGVSIIAFDAAAPAIAIATHIITTAAPDENGDPVLARYAAQIAAAPNLRYTGYLSTTGVYGDAGGAWVDEDTTPNPQSPRAQRRTAAEAVWSKFARPDSGHAKTVDIFRLAGIYGPGRSMLDDLREGSARRVVKPGHLFGRIHRDDIAAGVLKALQRPAKPGVNIFNFSDDEPAASADVVVEAARLLGVAPPAPVPFEQAAPRMTPMALSFWAENRRVSNKKTKAALRLEWLYPTYREGLAATLAEERTHGLA
ncbi:SDR family NAD(P)-dependent oxidoreductase [Acidocella sp.]|uniref:SDR family NAD(P)-dependent oxidoreductase n=1 Tax=Acidocella sp. TaxID=50710 RepID=UPI00262CF58D|nr:SDR family NAD(P)-dependent oxidoreductase [Acidocella sp.]MDD2795032.1 SDR family NAD(P)-dependent oxidoreductase [Acidocella sp.]